MAARAREAGSLALDTEADSLHSYFHKVCLIQATVGDLHALLDPLALDRAALAPLLEVLADPGVRVLMHGADYDLRVLDRDLGARVAGLQDTQVMAQLLGEPRTGLAALLERELGVRLDKRHQLANWGRRPLPRELLTYAAADTAFLPELAARLRARLERLGRWSWAEEEFRRLERVRHVPPEPDPLSFERVKGARRLRGAARDRLAALHAWRDRAARELDEPPFRVLGNAALLDLAQDPPGDARELKSRRGVSRRVARRWGSDLLRLLADPPPAPARPRRRHGGDRHLEAPARGRLERLRAARDRVANELGIEPGVLCPKATLVSVATAEPVPRSEEELAAAGLTGWRLEVLSAAVLAALGMEAGTRAP